MDTRVCEYMIAVAEEGTISAAAEKIHISQSALSQSLARLEKEVGSPLFERRERKMIPTIIGERYLQTAREFVSLKEDTYEKIRALSHNTEETVRIGICNQAYQVISDRIQNILKQRFPNLSINFYRYDSSAAMDLLKSGTVDLAVFARKTFYDPSLLWFELYQEHLVLIAPENHPDTFSPDNEPLILPNATTFLYGLMPEEFLKRRTAQITYKTADTHEMLKLTENGYGIALVPSRIISPESRCRVLDYPANISYSIYAAIQKQRTAGTMLEQVFHAVTELSAD